MQKKFILFFSLFITVFCFAGCSDSDDSAGYPAVNPTNPNPTTNVSVSVNIPDTMLPQDCGNITVKVGYSGTDGSFEIDGGAIFNRETNSLEFVALGENVKITSLTLYDDSSVVKNSDGTYAFAWWDLAEGAGNGTVIDLANNEFAGGAGTESDPYLVANPRQLDNVRKNLAGFYRQTKDIDFEGSFGMTASIGEDNTISFIPVHTNAPFYNAGAGWERIGTGVSMSDYFAGCYDGGGFKIDGLLINLPDGPSGNTCLFGFVGTGGGAVVDPAVIKNIVIGENSYINTSLQNGGIVGFNTGTISGCCNMGTIAGMSFVGGIVGLNAGIIINSYNAGTVNGTSVVGGIAGNNTGTISTSYNIGIVNGIDGTVASSSIGGIAGKSDAGVISDSYNTGTISGTSYIGGISGSTYGIISESYNTGILNGTSYVGGIAGDAYANTVKNTFYLAQGAIAGIGGQEDVDATTKQISVEQSKNSEKIVIEGGMTELLNVHLCKNTEKWVINPKDDGILGEGIFKGYSVCSLQLP